MRREAMKAKMILKKGMVFLFAMVMVLTGIFSLGVMAASGLEGAYISPKSKMGLQYANNFSRDVSKSQVSVPNFMADSDTNSEEPNKSFNAQQVAAGNSDAGQKWRGFAAYAKNHDPSDFWVKYKNVTTANGKSVDLKIEVTDWKTQNDESKPLPSNGDMFGHDNNSAHLGYAIGFSYKKTGVVMFSGFKWVKFKYTFLYNGTNTKAPFTGFATFQDIDQNQYVTITDGTECISKASYIGGSDGNTWCEPDGWTYKAIKDQNASSDMGKDTFNKTCISLYVKDMTDMSIKYGWTGHTAIAYFDLAPWAMNSFEDNANPDVPKKLIQSGSSWISNEKTSAVAYKLGDTYSYRYEDTTPTYATDILSNLWNGQNKTAISSYVWEDTLDSGLSYVAGSLQVNVGGEDFTSEFSDSSSGQNIKFSATSKALANTSFYGKKVTVTFKVKIKDASYNWLGHERTADNKYRLIPNTAKRSMTYLKKLAYDDKKEVYTVTDGDYTSIPQNTSTVWSKVPIGDPNNPDPDPKKTVSDEDEKNVLNNTLTNADETFTYTVSKEIEKNMPSTAKYSKVVIKDNVDSCLTIDSVKFYAGDKDVTSSFAPTSANKGNYLEYAASSDLLNNKDFYGNNAGTTVKMVIKTHIDAKKVSIETLRAHGHLVENDKKTETDIKIKNETTVTTTKADNQGTWDVDKKVTPPPTTTDSPVPSIKDPVKKVSDSDDLNWDATVKQDGEKTPGSHNRVTDVTNQWLYTLTQEIPAHTVELFHYKSFTITDAVDSCLSYDVKDIAIKAGDKDYTDKFDIKKGEDNSITLTAKADVLTSDEFYGGNAGNKIVVSFPVKISADAETLKDENLGHLEIDGKKLAHLQKVSDLQKLSGFTDLVKSKDNEYIDIPSLGLGVEGNPEKKTALFLVMPSGDSSYNLFINMFYTQLFTVLKRIADDRRDGQLPIHVRLWADEYYAGPKPLNCETLLGEIRSRNMSIVPILQDIAQIKTLYPNDKWEIFTGNCATTVFLGSGATAHTTHQWISDMLEDMTIDSRSENLGHSQGGGNLQMSKGGMKLMTPGQVSRMPKNDCILFLKGERPIYDKKNWSFDTEVFKEAQEIAGKNGYKNPVYVSYDEENRQYTTTRFESRLNYISQEDYEFYEEKAKTDDNIQTFQIDEDAFLYLNFNETPQPSLRELEKMVKKIQVSENSEDDENEGNEKKEDTVQDRKKWDLSGDIMDCFQRYSSELSQEEQEEIIKGIEDGLTDQEIKRYFALYGADKMQQYRRVLTARKNRG